MYEYKPNSHKSKEERIPERKVEKVVSGIVKPKKKAVFKSLRISSYQKMLAT